MRMATIASGSSGNCIYVSSEHCNLLIDAGVSMKRIETGLAQLGLTPADMDGQSVWLVDEQAAAELIKSQFQKHYQK